MLIIDPNEEHQILAVTTLGRAGYRVDSATTAREGLRLAREGRYDAIVIDHRLRDLGGFEVLGALNDIDRDTPKIYVAAAGSENVAIRAVERGATGYLLKTANFFELLPLEVEQQTQRLHLRIETEHQREALRASEERYRALFERARDPVFVVDSRGHFLALNRALCDLTGYERDELLRMNLFDLLLAEPDGNRASPSALLPTSPTHDALEFGVRRKNGSVAYVEVTTRLVQQGSLVVGVEAIARDITAKRSAERTLQRVYARLAAVYNASSDGILVVDESGVVVEANPRMSEILGVSRDALVGGDDTEILRLFRERVADPAEWTSEVDRASRDPGAVLSGDVVVTRPEPRILKLYAGPIRDAAGAVAGRVWVLGDVTSERMAKRRIEESERRFREQFEKSGDGVVLLDRDGRFLDANPAFCEMIGFSKAELVGHPARDVVAPSAMEEFDRSMDVIRRGGSFENELLPLKVRTKAGETRRVQIRYATMLQDGSYAGLSAIIRDVTEEHRAEQSIRELYGQLEAIFNSSIDGIAVFGPDGRVRALNWRLAEMLGVDVRQYAGRAASELINLIASMSANPGATRDVLGRFLDNAHLVLEGDLEFLTPVRRVVHQYGGPIYDHHGRAIGRLWTVRDVTSQRTAEEEIREKEGRYRDLFEYASNGILLVRPDGSIADANPAACELFGYSRDELLRMGYGDLLPASSTDRAAPGGASEPGGEGTRRVEVEVGTKGRGQRIVSIEERLILREGRRVATEVSLVDLTEKIEVGRRLEEASSRLAAMYDATLDGIIFYDDRDRAAAVNRRYLELWGFRERDVLGRHVDEINAVIRTYAEDPAAVDRTLREVLGNPDDVREYVRAYHSPQPRVLSWYSAPVRDAQGRRIGRLWVVRDVTALHQARQALESSEQGLREVIETVDEGIVRLSLEGAFLWVNPSACQIFGREDADLLGRPVFEFAPAGSEAALRANLDGVLGGGERGHRFEVEVRLKDGTARPVEFHARVAARAGSPSSLIASIRDLTERKEVERRLLQSDRLASLGQLSAFVAHEINTPLTNISLLTAGIARRTQDPEVVQKLEKINSQRRLASSIISDLLKFTRRTEPTLVEMDVRKAIELALEDADSYRDPNVRVRRELGERPLPISGDPVQVQEVVANIVKNAYEATERGHVEVRAARRADGHVVVSIEDTGPGIAPENMPKLFEPFFTTKKLGKGTGLGLTICQNIMNAHGGHIEVESHPGRGTRFTLVFRGGPRP